ncbi:uncharacterized protein LOC123302317 [Chrysoperla carnea]|uniref:uncharacterized protein LOC123302317 n=1 Tax=Chrysoperla carnea TaxID=189513 RepID=UPI001D06A8C2|nr:uncharacterized protein LOC123302317 [Chrysoperla carnea]
MGPKKDAEDIKMQLFQNSILISEHEGLISKALEIGKQAIVNSSFIPNLEARFSKLEKLFDTFKSLISNSNKLANLGENKEEIENLCKRSEVVHDKYYEILAIEIQIRKSTKTIQSTTQDDVLASQISHSAASKLPNINIPTFDGDISKWVSFRDTFVSLIHDAPGINHVAKFHYLRSALKGNALQTIAGIQVNMDNYTQAWEAMLKKYDNKRLQASYYLSKIFNFKPVIKASLSQLELLSSIVIENAIAFKNLKLKNESGFILVYFIIRLLDHKTKEKFEDEYGKNSTIPKFEDLIKFIETECLKFQTENLTSDKSVNNYPAKPTYSNKQVVMTQTQYNPDTCAVCKGNHPIFKCSNFLALQPSQRLNKIKQLNGCHNCLKTNHEVTKCPSQSICKECKRKHNTLLHIVSGSQTFSTKTKGHSLQNIPLQTNNIDPNRNQTENSNTINTVLSATVSGAPTVLLGTALARIKDHLGRDHNIRILVDSGAQRSFITTSFIDKLRLAKQPNLQPLSGLSNMPIRGGRMQVECVIHPLNSSTPELQTTAIVVPSIITQSPTHAISNDIRKIFKNLNLADATFDKPGPIDFLLGADLFGQILLGESKTPSKYHPAAIKSVFGWILIGSISHKNSKVSPIHNLLVSESSIHNLIERFWKIEDTPHSIPMSLEEKQCEEHFKTTHSRNDSGRYIVRLPFKQFPPKLGNSKSQAYLRYMRLEQKFIRNPKLKTTYDSVINEYMDLGYLSVAKDPGAYILPHHGVEKPSSSTSLRVVFDASCSTESGSLNDKLLTGPTLQSNITEVILHFRTYAVAMSTDICKMYLQIILHENDRKYQHMFYRFNPSDSITEYELNRVTFGMPASPYLAIRVILQLIQDEGAAYPLASNALANHTYVDNILTGAHNLNDALALQKELIHLLQKGGFTLKKWASSSKELLKTVPIECHETPIAFSTLENSTIKVLGMQWDPVSDCLSYAVQAPQIILTKRAVLSNIAKLYDPLGYLSPIIFKAKCIMKQTWKINNLKWDDPLPDEIASQWCNFLNQLQTLSHIKIPRCIINKPYKNITILGFADASKLGYASTIYLRLTKSDNSVSINLLMSKTRLAPISTISIPRLELCAALLLVKTFQSIKPFISSLEVDKTYLFSDSTVVLDWLKHSPRINKVFEANRVAEILRNTVVTDWYHVESEHNPADIASRGIDPCQLKSKPLWWFGPQWLQNEPSSWPITQQKHPQQQEILILNTKQHSLFNDDWMKRFSSYSKLVRTMAYILRFIDRLKKKQNVPSGLIQCQEFNKSTLNCIKLIQKEYFSDEIKAIKSNEKSKLSALAPFIDPSGIIRVGGRLTNSPLQYSHKHPIILPKRAHFTHLLIDYLHHSYLHAGPQLLQALIQRKYWIVAARSAIKSRIFQCIKCYKLKPKNYIPYMSALPSSRFEQGRAFLNVGIDYAGPFLIKDSNRRKPNISKTYVGLYVCMSTKAIHVELVTDLSTKAFLASFDRFIARRGIPSQVFSDNGTNFVGACRYLREIYKWLKQKEIQSTIIDYATNKGIVWKFNPPASPNFGGLWEAGVKSFKNHLIRTLEKRYLTFEEFNTLIVRIEAMLNSRPSYPLSSSPDEYEVLTPGHFLIGAPLVAPPEQDLTDIKNNRLDRWQLISQTFQHIWQKWRLNYLNTLQQRLKWQTKEKPVAINDLVLLKEPNAPSLNWPKGRIIEVYPGRDNQVRVVKIKTQKGEYTRPITQIVPLLPPCGDKQN